MKASTGSMKFSGILALSYMVNPNVAKELFELLELASRGRKALAALDGICAEFGITLPGTAATAPRRMAAKPALAKPMQMKRSTPEKNELVLRLLRAKLTGGARFEAARERAYAELGIADDPSREHRVRIMIARTQGKYRGDFVYRILHELGVKNAPKAEFREALAELARIYSTLEGKRIMPSQLKEEASIANNARIGNARRPER